MAIVTSSNKTTNQINSNNLKQLDSVFTEKEDDVSSAKDANAKSETKPKKTATKKDNSDTLLLNLPKGERAKFKAFCALNNITMTDFIYFSMDFVKDMVEQGKYTVGRSGIKIVPQD